MRVPTHVPRRRRTKKIMKAAKGFQGQRSHQYKLAKETLQKGGMYGFTSRKLKKRDYRSLWILRISAAAKAHGLSYSRLMGALKKVKVALDRKVLAHLAAHEEAAFARICALAKGGA
jgi:large subunit ribosomal protein L20